MMTLPDYHIVSFSGGKDSTAMLLRMIELGMHIDEVANFDTGVEFPQMYDHINRISNLLKDNGIKFTVFRSEQTFEHILLERERVGLDNITRYGWGWPNMSKRWCTRHLKTRLIESTISELSKSYNVIQYLGIASDETKRTERKDYKNFRYPLIEWGWKEKDCLSYCYDKGYDWEGLYRIFWRVSCWACPLQRIGELYALWDNFPDLWNQLRIWDGKLIEIYGSGIMTYKMGYSIEQLEKRFAIEKRRRKNNLSLSSPNFFKEIDLTINGPRKNQTTLEVF